MTRAVHSAFEHHYGDTMLFSFLEISKAFGEYGTMGLAESHIIYNQWSSVEPAVLGRIPFEFSGRGNLE